jgi:phosphatidate cytidylyltransferase
MKERLKSSALLIGGIGLILLIDSMTGSDLPCGFAIALSLMLACAEFRDMCVKHGMRLPLTALMLFIPLLLLAIREDFYHPGSGFCAITILSFFAVAVFLQLLKKDAIGRTINLALTLFAFGYIVVLGSFLYRIRLLDGGFLLLIYVVATAKVSDTGALLVGRLFGRHKLIPWISPNKTVEGFLGGIAAGLAFSLLTHDLLAKGRFGIFTAVFFGIAVSLASVSGDLLESMLKRDSGIKDSGRFLPGLGGVLDIVDSLLISAPAAYFIFRLIS